MARQIYFFLFKDEIQEIEDFIKKDLNGVIVKYFSQDANPISIQHTSHLQDEYKSNMYVILPYHDLKKIKYKKLNGKGFCIENQDKFMTYYPCFFNESENKLYPGILKYEPKLFDENIKGFYYDNNPEFIKWCEKIFQFIKKKYKLNNKIPIKTFHRISKQVEEWVLSGQGSLG